jgi:hypothetical protein
MNNLTKENFWNDMYLKYPLAMKAFCKWIDEYKEKNKWKRLFNSNYKLIHSTDHEGTTSSIISEPKFHDLPLAMQMGIWGEYLDEFELTKCKEMIEVIMYGMDEGLKESASEASAEADGN